jgi:hypothetical protein
MAANQAWADRLVQRVARGPAGRAFAVAARLGCRARRATLDSPQAAGLSGTGK